VHNNNITTVKKMQCTLSDLLLLPVVNSHNQ